MVCNGLRKVQREYRQERVREQEGLGIGFEKGFEHFQYYKKLRFVFDERQFFILEFGLEELGFPSAQPDRALSFLSLFPGDQVSERG